MARLSLSAKQAATGAGAELLAMCQSMTEDGRLDGDEIIALSRWLKANRQNADLPAIGFLAETVERIIADQFVTIDERQELYDAIKKVLPVDVRKAATVARRTLVRRRKDADREAKVKTRLAERIARAAERERNRVLARLDFLLAGHFADDRPKIIKRHCSEGDEVALVRDLRNKYSRYAIQVRVPQGLIGFVPDDLAQHIYPVVEAGCVYAASIKVILDGGRSPLPVIAGTLHGTQCTRPGVRPLGCL